MQRKITICGAGTLGGNLAENLARIGFNNIAIIDNDMVESRNLSNQPYFSNNVGQPKVRAMSELLYRAVGAKISAIKKKFTPGNGLKFLRDSHLVIDTFDNHLSRKAVAQICRNNRIPCLHAGIDNNGYGEIMWNDIYKVPPDGGEDACEKPLNRNLSILVVAAATETILRFLEKRKKDSYTITLKDMAINEL